MAEVEYPGSNVVIVSAPKVTLRFMKTVLKLEFQCPVTSVANSLNFMGQVKEHVKSVYKRDFHYHVAGVMKGWDSIDTSMNM